MKKTNLTDQQSWPILIVSMAILLGGIVRFTPVVMSDFPLNDGGMFFAMIRDLQANHYLLPAITTYNGLGIPFTYPPLSFYLGGVLADLLHLSLLDILHWLPAVISTLAILAFYFMASVVLDSRSQAALASMAFALMPRSFSWFIIGGGLSRSLGQLFLLFTIYSAYMLFTRKSRRHLAWLIVSGALVTLSHPEAMVHAAAICLLFWLFFARRREGLFLVLIVGAGVALLSAPWWLTVVLQHGFSPFLVASQTGGYDWLFWTSLVTPNFAEENFVTILTVLGLLGLAIQLVRHRYLLPIWLALPFVVEPRSANAIAIIPLALMVGIALSDLVLPGLAAMEQKVASLVKPNSDDWTVYGSRSLAVRLVIGYVLFSALISAFVYSLGLSSYYVGDSDRTAMHWVRANTSENSRFLVLTGTQALSDPVQEWFPALSGRRSQSTPQGLEWTLGQNFRKFLGQVSDLQGCMNRQQDCLSDWALANDRPYDYVYLDRYEIGAKNREAASSETPGLLLYSLQNSADYEQVYRSDAVVIFSYRPTVGP